MSTEVVRAQLEAERLREDALRDTAEIRENLDRIRDRLDSREAELQRREVRLCNRVKALQLLVENYERKTGKALPPHGGALSRRT